MTTSVDFKIVAEMFTTPGPGRPPGLANKTTVAAREAIARLVDGFAPRLADWLEEIYRKDGPTVAFKCVMDVVEYHIPKLARMEVNAGEKGTVIFIGASEGDVKLLVSTGSSQQTPSLPQPVDTPAHASQARLTEGDRSDDPSRDAPGGS